MNKKLAKIKYLPNNFEILEQGDHVICAISGKPIRLEHLNYWNVDLTRTILFIQGSRNKEREQLSLDLITSIDCETISIDLDFLDHFF